MSITPNSQTDEISQGEEMLRSSRKRVNGALFSSTRKQCACPRTVDLMDHNQLRKMLRRTIEQDDLGGVETSTSFPAGWMTVAGGFTATTLPPLPRRLPRPISSQPPQLKPVSAHQGFKPPVIYSPTRPVTEDTSSSSSSSEEEEDYIASVSPPSHRAASPLPSSPPAPQATPIQLTYTPDPQALDDLCLTAARAPRQPTSCRLPLMADPAYASSFPWYFAPPSGVTIEDDGFIPGEFVGADWRQGFRLPRKKEMVAPTTEGGTDRYVRSGSTEGFAGEAERAFEERVRGALRGDG